MGLCPAEHISFSLRAHRLSGFQAEGYQSRPFGCEVGSQFHHGTVSRGSTLQIFSPDILKVTVLTAVLTLGAQGGHYAITTWADLLQAKLAIVLSDNPVALAGAVFKFLAVHDLHCATGVLDDLPLLQNTSCQAHARPICA